MFFYDEYLYSTWWERNLSIVLCVISVICAVICTGFAVAFDGHMIPIMFGIAMVIEAILLLVKWIRERSFWNGLEDYWDEKENG